jgi:hypothetical protein
MRKALPIGSSTTGVGGGRRPSFAFVAGLLLGTDAVGQTRHVPAMPP